MVALTIGLLALFAHVTGAYALGSWMPGTATVRANAAVASALLGAAELLQTSRRAASVDWSGRAAAMLAGTAALIGGITLLEWVPGLPVGIDGLLFPVAPDDVGVVPGRMAPPAAAVFVLIGVCLLARRFRWPARVAEAAAAIALVISSVVVAGQLYGAVTLASIGGNVTAVPTGVAILAMSSGELLRTRDGILVRWIADDGLAGRFVRRVMPLVPMLAATAWVGLQARKANIVPFEYFAAGAVVVFSVMLILFATNAAAMVSRLERHQERTDAFNDMVMGDIDEGVVTTDAQGVITSWSAGAATIFGYSADEMVGRTPEILYPADARRSGPQYGHSFNGDWRAVRADGRPVDVHILARPMVDGKGAVVGGFAVVNDVSRTLADQRQLRRLAAAVEQSAESVVMTDLAGNITYVNPAFERLTGYARAEVVGRNPRLLKSGKQPPAFYRAMWGALLKGLPWVAEVTNRRKDGSLYVEEAVFTPIRDDDGTVISYVAVKRDVTQERALESAAAAAARERALIGDTLRRLPSGMSAEGTADAICEQVASVTGVTHAHILAFDPSGIAQAIGFASGHGISAPHRALAKARSRELLTRCSEGPWIEQWRPTPGHPYAEMARALGVRAVAYLPIVRADDVIGLLVVGSARTDALSSLPELMPSLAEFGELAGVLLAPAIDHRRDAMVERQEMAAMIRRGAFAPVFQPIVDLQSGRALGYEALTRFADGTRPDLVFAQAARLGLGAELEKGTLAAAVVAAGALPRGTFLSLNVSPALLLGDGSLPFAVDAAARDIVLEITEHEVIADYARLRDRLLVEGRRLPIAVDDAGAGVANFTHLVELRPDFVKIDIGLVRGVDTDVARQAIVAALLHFARQTSCRVIAEGVETDAERSALIRLGVDLAQGYLFGKPAPAETWSLPSTSAGRRRRAGTQVTADV